MSAAVFNDLSPVAKPDAIERIEGMPYAFFGVQVTIAVGSRDKLKILHSLEALSMTEL